MKRRIDHPPPGAFAIRLAALRAQVDHLQGNWRALTDDNREIGFNALRLQCDLICDSAAAEFGTVLPEPARRGWREKFNGRRVER